MAARGIVFGAVLRGVTAAPVTLTHLVQVRILAQERPVRGPGVSRRYSQRVSDAPPAAVIVLAAGEGTRMKSRLPKVLHELGGRTMLGHVLAAALPLGAARTAVVIGAGREQVAAALPSGESAGVTAVVQEQQLGTGHAVRVAVEALDAAAALDDAAAVLVVPGDTPLLRTETLAALLDLHAERHAAATLLSAVVDDPTGYGRVVREEGDGPVREVVEERDADAVTREINEVATGVYAFAAGQLRAALGKLTTDNAQGEQYLPDVVAGLVTAGEVVQALRAGDAAETAGVNDRVQLAAAGRVLNGRLLEAAMRAGCHRDRPRDDLAVRRDRPRTGRHAPARRAAGGAHDGGDGSRRRPGLHARATPRSALMQGFG